MRKHRKGHGVCVTIPADDWLNVHSHHLEKCRPRWPLQPRRSRHCRCRARHGKRHKALRPSRRDFSVGDDSSCSQIDRRLKRDGDIDLNQPAQLDLDRAGAGRPLPGRQVTGGRPASEGAKRRVGRILARAFRGPAGGYACGGQHGCPLQRLPAAGCRQPGSENRARLYVTGVHAFSIAPSPGPL
jgi:hypothetical protein